MASFFPKALLYREWRDGRLVYLLAGLLTFAPGLATLFNYWSLPNSGMDWQSQVEQFWQAYSQSTTQFQGQIVPSGFLVLVWLVVPALRIISERSRGGLAVLLSSPVKRTDWMRTKFWFGFAILTMASFVQFICLWLLHFKAPVPYVTTALMVFREVGIHWILFMSVYAFGYFVALCVSNIIAAVIFTYGILLAPMWLNIVFGEIISNSQMSIGQTGNTAMFVPQGSWVYLIQWLSPLGIELQGGFTWLNPWLYWYLVFTAICYIGGVAYFRHMRAERFQNFLTRSSLWYYLLTGFSLVLGSLFGGMLTSARTTNVVHTEQYHANLFTISFLLFSAAIWLVVWSGVKVRGRRRSSSRGTRMRTIREG